MVIVANRAVGSFPLRIQRPAPASSNWAARLSQAWINADWPFRRANSTARPGSKWAQPSPGFKPGASWVRAWPLAASFLAFRYSAPSR